MKYQIEQFFKNQTGLPRLSKHSENTQLKTVSYNLVLKLILLISVLQCNIERSHELLETKAFKKRVGRGGGISSPRIRSIFYQLPLLGSFSSLLALSVNNISYLLFPCPVSTSVK